MPQFIYFDLGNVLLYFDHEIAVRQMAQTAGIPSAKVREIVFDSGLQWSYEEGQISDEEFFAEFCRRGDVSPGRHQLMHAASAIFQPNVRITPLVCQLRSAGYRLGILSNTCQAHWNYVINNYRITRDDIFDVYALSFQMKAMKPKPQAYSQAASLAGTAAEEIFFVDDRPENVAAARQAGFDAVIYNSASCLAEELRGRGVTINY